LRRISLLKRNGVGLRRKKKKEKRKRNFDFKEVQVSVWSIPPYAVRKRGLEASPRSGHIAKGCIIALRSVVSH